MIALPLAAIAMLASAVGESGVVLQIDAPAVVDARTNFTVSFTVSNRAPEGVYFKRPWKWATNGMYLQAVDGAGKVYESSPFLVDISTEVRCTFFKPLGSGESFTFQESMGPLGPLPSLPLPGPGRYRLKWIYDVKHYDDERACAFGGWPIWRGRTTSPEIEIVVK